MKKHTKESTRAASRKPAKNGKALPKSPKSVAATFAVGDIVDHGERHLPGSPGECVSVIPSKGKGGSLIIWKTDEGVAEYAPAAECQLIRKATPLGSDDKPESFLIRLLVADHSYDPSVMTSADMTAVNNRLYALLHDVTVCASRLGDLLSTAYHVDEFQARYCVSLVEALRIRLGETLLDGLSRAGFEVSEERGKAEMQGVATDRRERDDIAPVATIENGR